MKNPFDHIFNLPSEPVIVFEDYYLAVIQKPFGYTVEKHHTYNSLETFLEEHLKKTFPQNKKHFTGIVHRLDLHTAGLVVIAKTPAALKHLNKQFEEKTTVKKYMACVEGIVANTTGKIEGFITEDKTTRTATFHSTEIKNSKSCSLTYEVKETNGNFSLLSILLETGRFHQIRASLKFLGHPIVNDEKYGAKKISSENKILLFAYEQKFIHPKTGEISAYNLLT